jgi:hypothetical protein
MPGAYDQKSIQIHFEGTNKRLAAIEAQLAVVCEKLGIDYAEPTAGISDDVKELAQSGKTIEAMKLYREQTGASGDEAREVVQGL